MFWRLTAGNLLSFLRQCLQNSVSYWLSVGLWPRNRFFTRWVVPALEAVGARCDCSPASSLPRSHGITHAPGRVHVQAWKTLNFTCWVRSAGVRSGLWCRLPALGQTHARSSVWPCLPPALPVRSSSSPGDVRPSTATPIRLGEKRTWISTGFLIVWWEGLGCQWFVEESTE